MSESGIRHRDLESDLFGIRVSDAHVDSVASASEVAEAFSHLPPGLLVVRVPATELDAAQRIERAGGRLCDVLLTMSQRFGPTSSIQSNDARGVLVRASNADDVEQIRRIATRAFADFRGHWHSDALIPRDLADLLYARWAVDLARNNAPDARMFVATTPHDEVIGFLCLSAGSRDRWSVPLTAVDTAFRGRGVLRALLGFGSRELAAHRSIELQYETQLTNVNALRSVSRFGLVPSESRLTFHLWSADT